MELYDLIIIGTGPAGLTASIYASCFHLKHLVIGTVLGGQMMNAPDILNYPGFEEISGKELTDRMVEQVKKRGGELVTGSVTRITQLSNQQITQSSNNPITSPSPSPNRRGDGGEVHFEIETQEENKYQAKAIILATGTERRKLNVPGEVEYTSKGVHYCATCEKQDYAGKVCGVVGGGNSAVQAAVELSQAAAKVYIIYRGTQLRGDPIWLEQVEKNQKIEVIYNTVVTEIIGDGEKVTGVKLQAATGPATHKNFAEVGKNFSAHPSSLSSSGQASLKQQSVYPERSEGLEKLASPQNSKSPTLPADNLLQLDKLFIEIGGVPGTALVIPLGVKMDPGGYIIVDERLVSNVPGVFAAGDLVSYGLSIEQISSAVGLGARAAASAFAFLKQDKAPIVWGGSQIKR